MAAVCLMVQWWYSNKPAFNRRHHYTEQLVTAMKLEAGGPKRTVLRLHQHYGKVSAVVLTLSHDMETCNRNGDTAVCIPNLGYSRK